MISRAIVWVGLCMIIPLLVWLVGCEQKPENNQTLLMTPADTNVFVITNSVP